MNVRVRVEVKVIMMANPVKVGMWCDTPGHAASPASLVGIAFSASRVSFARVEDKH